MALRQRSLERKPRAWRVPKPCSRGANCCYWTRPSAGLSMQRSVLTYRDARQAGIRDLPGYRANVRCCCIAPA